MKVKHTDSYYAASRNQHFDFPKLMGEHVADVCVIGSGITGATAALELANRGFKVIVLEANRVGWAHLDAVGAKRSSVGPRSKTR